MASSLVLVRSKLMAMAVAIANLSSSGFIKATSDRAKFDAQLAAALRPAKHTAAPSPAA